MDREYTLLILQLDTDIRKQSLPSPAIFLKFQAQRLSDIVHEQVGGKEAKQEAKFSGPSRR